MQSNIANLMGGDLITEQIFSVDLQQAERHAVFFSGIIKQGEQHD